MENIFSSVKEITSYIKEPFCIKKTNYSTQ